MRVAALHRLDKEPRAWRSELERPGGGGVAEAVEINREVQGAVRELRDTFRPLRDILMYPDWAHL
eukprot:4096900-Prymnesium_polylepis.1